MEAIHDSDFPKYRDGDVAIIVSSMKIYQLHSSILRRNSPFFARELDVKPGAKLTSAARREGLAAYRFELRKRSARDIGVFERKDVTESGRTQRAGFLLPDLDNGKVANEQHRYWDWLFGAFYNRQPDFDDHNLATVLSGCMGLVDVAESIGSVDHVRELVDLALLRQDETLWTSIASNPTAWAELGRRVHSPTIFSEGVCHIVGKWQNMTDEDKNELHTDVRDLCDRKFKEIDIAKEAIEMRILGHYPVFICRNVTHKPGRPAYANDIYMWMAICFFRQWFAQSISDGRNRLSPDGGYQFYRSLAEGGPAYLDHEAFKNFHQYFPMSSKACSVLEANMAVLKEDVKPFVKDLVVERTHVKSKTYAALEWLTCAVITKEDYPWRVREDVFMGNEFLVNQSLDNEDDWNSPLPALPARSSRPGRPRKSQVSRDQDSEATLLNSSIEADYGGKNE